MLHFIKRASLVGGTLAAFIGVAALAAPVQAQVLTEASQIMCEKFKSCTAAELEADTDLTDQMREMMNTMIDDLCMEMKDRFTDERITGELVAMADACMRSFGDMTCEALNNDEQSSACQEYEALGRQMGLDTE